MAAMDSAVNCIIPHLVPDMSGLVPSPIKEVSNVVPSYTKEMWQRGFYPCPYRMREILVNPCAHSGRVKKVANLDYKARLLLKVLGCLTTEVLRDNRSNKHNGSWDHKRASHKPQAQRRS